MNKRIACAIVVFLSTHAFAAPGDLEPSFGTAGRVLLDLAKMPREISAAAPLPGGAYLAGGTATPWSSTQSRLMRFNADHSRDLTYGSAGSAPLIGIPKAIKVVGGKAIVLETTPYFVEDPVTFNLYNDAFISRYNENGTRDATFGVAGRTAPFDATTNGGGQGLNAVAVRSDGKLVAGGWAMTAQGQSTLLVVRYNADGTFDNTFGTNGVLKVAVSASPMFQEIRGIDVALDGTNRMLAVGVADNRAFYMLMEANGSLVNSARFNTTSSCNATVRASATRWLVACGGEVTGLGRRAWLFALDNAAGPDATFTDALTNLGGSDDAWRALAVHTDGTVYTSGIGQGRLALGAFSASGAPITAFGSAGVYLLAGPETSAGNAIAILSNGSLLAAGTRSNGTDGEFTLARLTRDTGTLLGTAFLKDTPATGAGGVIAHPDGRITIGGISGTGAAPFYFATRLQPNGGIDATFGVAGTSSQQVPGMEAFPGVRDMVMQPDGKVLVTGELGGSESGEIRLGAVRLLATGGGDPGFGPGTVPGLGYAVSATGQPLTFTRSVRLQSDGKIVAAGNGFVGGRRQIAVARLNTNGSVDGGYGASGIATSAFELNVSARAADLTSDGRAIAVGDASGALRLVRFTSAGQLDTSFGTGGMTTFAMPSGIVLQLANRVLMQGDKAVVIATAQTGTNFGALFVRFNANGTLDTTFDAPNGWTYVPTATGTSGIFRGGTVMPSGKVVAVGYSGNDNSSLKGTVARVNRNGGADATFGAGGVRYYGDDGVSLSQLEDADTAPDGSLVLTGYFGVASDSQAVVYKTQAEASAVASMTDLDGDGKGDLLWRNSLTGQVYRMRMDGMSIVSQGFAYNEPNTQWRIVADADFNGDGTSDLLWRNAATGQLYFMPFGGGMPSAGGTLFYTEANAAWRIVHTPDLDGDGKADLLWWNSSTGQVYAMLMNGGSIGAQGFVYTEPNTQWRIQAVGDFSGSGKKNQLLWYHLGTGQVYLMTVGYSGGAFSQSGGFIYAEPNTVWGILGTPDLNGDGKSDLLWRNGSTGQVWGMLMNGPAIASQGLLHYEPNLAWKIVSWGDYNGDGASDLLWRNADDGRVYMMLMNGLSIASQGMVYTEPNAQWQLMGPLSYAQ